MFEILFNKTFTRWNDVVKFINLNFDKKEFKLNKILINKLSHFSTPTVEQGALDLVKNVFPEYRGKEISKNVLKPSDVLEADNQEISIYCKDKIFSVKKPVSLKKCIDWMESKFYEKSASQEIKLIDAINILPKNTSSGFPDFIKKGSDRSIENTYARYSELLRLGDSHQMFDYLIKFPTVIFHRFTPKYKFNKSKYIDPKWKIRQIFGVPQFIVCAEVIVFYDFINRFKRNLYDFHTIGLTKKQVSERVKKVRDKAKLEGKFILCGDISGCDKSVSKDHQLIFFNFASKYISKENFEIFKALAKYSIFTPILTRDGVKYTKGSTLTGSWITTSFTTFTIMIPLLYAFVRINNRFPKPGEMLVQGDDFIILLDEQCHDKFYKKCMLEFNLRLRLDKSRVVKPFDDIEFLGYFWNYYNEPDQTNDWIVARILFPEKFVRFTGPLRIIYKYLSVMINIKRFRILFNRFLNYDIELLNLYRFNTDPTFKLVDAQGNITNVKIPLSMYLKLGWRLL